MRYDDSSLDHSQTGGKGRSIRKKKKTVDSNEESHNQNILN